jgi:hypothetical protein
MKDKVITIKPKGISQKQWSILLLDLHMSAPGLKRIVDWGTKKYGTDHTK